MTSFAQMVAADRRLLILKALAAAAEYTAARRLLIAFLSSWGRRVSSDVVAGDLAWLAEQGLVELRNAGEESIGKLTDRGLDVAEGRANCPGVRRPAPGED